MQPKVTDETEWKLDLFIKREGGPLPVDKFSFNQKVRELVDHYKNRKKSWAKEVAEMEDDGGVNSVGKGSYYRVGMKHSTNKSLPDFDGETRRPTVDDDLADELQKAAEALTNRDLDGLSFNDQLDVVLQKWNDYAAYINIGWGTDHRNPPITPEPEPSSRQVKRG